MQGRDQKSWSSRKWLNTATTFDPQGLLPVPPAAWEHQGKLRTKDCDASSCNIYIFKHRKRQRRRWNQERCKMLPIPFSQPLTWHNIILRFKAHGAAHVLVEIGNGCFQMPNETNSYIYIHMLSLNPFCSILYSDYHIFVHSTLFQFAMFWFSLYILLVPT